MAFLLHDLRQTRPHSSGAYTNANFPALLRGVRGRHYGSHRPFRCQTIQAESADYFGGAGGVKISRLRPGSGFGFGLGAFFASLFPLSLFPMAASMTQKRGAEKAH
jgi:hypothetical protein